jgi:hypothetical protein
MRLLRAIATILASMASYVLKAVWEGGQYVLRLFREDPPPAQAMPVIPQVEEPSPEADRFMPTLRRVLRAYVVGERPAPEDLQALPPVTRDWARVLDQRQVQMCLAAADDQLGAHLRGKQPIRGLIPHDKESVEVQMKARNSGQRAKLEARAEARRKREQEAPAP